MEKKIAGLLGAVAALGTLATAQAAPVPSDVLKAGSYADLLEPIPNAARTLQALEQHAAAQPADVNVQVAQFYHHHHRHHHHGYWHHHHHHGYYRGGVVVVPRRRFYHHHHHHHHHHSGVYFRY
ncbi:hypothetical protein [Bradyrhizobium viridifuturi]|uniref:hypothetical protein n=1 Tax=Bradyrhizobium viridifuturi TaxID=1654716 RepID=UPI000ADFE868|nr:hypothetical protein [Bradyrhizobium viridifuturi]